MMKSFKRLLIITCVFYLTASCGQPEAKTQKISFNEPKKMTTSNLDTATFGGGCFWCVEAIYQQLKGVQSVVSGFSGGARPNPSYEQVCSGATGHAEVIQLTYNPQEISFDELLEVFWSVHDPTTLNRQGADVGTQYRSVIFYHNLEQKATAEKYKKKLNDEKAFDNPVVTEIAPFTAFYSAEKYHQDYYNQNGSQPYCTLVVRPKVEKFKKAFKDKLKSSAVQGH